jgi:hypothetical protein
MTVNETATEILQRKAKKLGSKQIPIVVSEAFFSRLKNGQLAESNELGAIVSLQAFIVSAIEEKLATLMD